MNTQAHTPGPWSVCSQAGYSGHKVDDANGRSVAAFPSSSRRSEDERNANARLIAAAPDMLAAQRCIDDMLAGEQAGLHLFQGKCVMNIAPDDAADKADAVMSLVGRAGAESALFAGDDVNDEPVFERVPTDWLTLKVGRDGPPSSARFIIDTHEEIGSLLQELLQMAKGTAGRPSQSS
jgi:trehalose 6-phosphate phosphatase